MGPENATQRFTVLWLKLGEPRPGCPSSCLSAPLWDLPARVRHQKVVVFVPSVQFSVGEPSLRHPCQEAEADPGYLVKSTGSCHRPPLST